MNARRVVTVVLACHFASSFGALGMPPFLSLVLRDLAPDAGPRLAGLLYVLPTAAMAISSPAWGMIADRWGRKTSLMRAQLGLAASFALAGLAPGIGLFAVALCLQGLLGGTFSASNAYLARTLPRAVLTQSLNLTQASARLALILAPLAIGLLVDGGWRAQHLYLLLAGLPLMAFCLVAGLPTEMAGGEAADARVAVPTPCPDSGRPLPLTVTMLCQASFTVALIASFPFFVPFAIQRLGVDAGLAGWLFGVPHIVYLATCIPLGRRLRPGDPARWFAIGCLILSASMLLQIAAHSMIALVLARIVMGLGMTLGYLALNGMIAAAVRADNAGRAFGWFDGVAKSATVFTGIGAGQVAALLGLSWIFAGAAVLALPVALLPLSRHRLDLRPSIGN